MDNELKLWYKQSAKRWVDGLPLGNGRLGAMVLGGVAKERIALNEDTLWTGTIKDKHNYKSIEYLAEARKLILAEKYYEAQELMNEKMLGDWTESYLPLGNIYLEFKDVSAAENYRRELDLNTAVSTVAYTCGEINYKRTYFISKPDNVLVMKFEADQENKLNFEVFLDSLVHYHSCTSKNGVAIIGKAPIANVFGEPDDKAISYDESGKLGMNFIAKAIVSECDGQVQYSEGKIIISNASKAVLMVDAETSFNGWDKEPGNEGKDYVGICNKLLEEVKGKKYKDIYEDHLADYGTLFNNISLEIGNTINDIYPTDERLARVKDGKEDLSLISLYFQYGRYLLISCSREGTQAANLQGIWNEDLRAAWNSNYTVNINTEMNYWPAEATNLSSCHQPLFDLIKGIAETGRKTAQVEFGCRGWCANHNSDIWRHTVPVRGSVEWAYWPMAGAWLCQHLWQHYEFTMDLEFLRKEAYPLMKGAAEFLLDWLISDKNNNLITCPSISPENAFLDNEKRECRVSAASTMDMAITRDLFKSCIKACEILNIDDEFKKELCKAKERLYPYKINDKGCIQEWFKDFAEREPGHRHLSHLFGLYPGNDITEDNRELFNAAKNTVDRRLSFGGGHTGWSCTWVVNLYARLKEGELAKKYLNILFSKLTYPNLFCVHPPFQIDGNFGGTAAIAEMLIQSHNNYVEVLPALPLTWNKGAVRGLKARGGFEVSFAWTENEIDQIQVKSLAGSKLDLRYKNKKISLETKAEEYYLFDKNLNLL